VLTGHLFLFFSDTPSFEALTVLVLKNQSHDIDVLKTRPKKRWIFLSVRNCGKASYYIQSSIY